MALDVLGLGAGKIELQLVLDGVLEAKRALASIERQIQEFADVIGVSKRELTSLGIGFKRFRREAESFAKLLRAEFRWIAGFQLIRGLQNVFSDTVGSIVQFDKALVDLKAQALATEGDMLFLKKAIIDTAKSTTFGIREIGNLATVLARAGLSGFQVSMILKPIAQMAMVTGEKLDIVGKLLISIMGTYNATVGDAYKITDLLATALNKSKLDLSDIADAWKYVAGNISTSRDSLSEVLAVMMTVKDVGGFTASTIGTGLRQLYNTLIKMPPNLKKYLVSVGFTKKDFDEINLSTNRLITVLGKLREKGVNVWEVIRHAQIRAGNFLAVLLNNYDKLVENFKALELAQAEGDLYKMVDTYLMSMDSRFKLLRNNIQATFAQLRDTVSPLVIDTLSGFSKTFETAVNFLNSATGKALIFSSAMLILKRNIGVVGEKFLTLLPITNSFKSIVGIFQNIGNSLRALNLVAISGIFTKWKQAGLSAVAKDLGKITFSLSGLKRFITPITIISSAFLVWKTNVISLKTAIELLSTAIGVLLLKSRPVIGIFTILSSTISLVGSQIEKMNKKILDLPNNLQESISILPKMVEFLSMPPEAVARMKDSIKETLQEFKKSFYENLSPQEKEKFDTLYREFLQLPTKETAQSIQNFIRERFQNLIDTTINSIDNYRNELRKKLDQIKKTEKIDFTDPFEVMFYSREKKTQYPEKIKRTLNLLNDLREKVLTISRNWKEGTKFLQKSKTKQYNVLDDIKEKVKGVTLRIKELNESWKYATEIPATTVSDIKMILNIYKSLSNEISKLNKIRNKANVDEIKRIEALAQLNKKKKELIDTTKRFLSENNLNLRQIANLKVAFEKAKISVKDFSDEMKGSYLRYINEFVQDSRSLLQVLKSVKVYGNFIDNLFGDTTKAEIYNKLIKRTVELWQKGLLQASTIKKLSGLLPTESFKQLKEALPKTIANDISTFEQNLRILSKTGYDYAQVNEYVNRNLNYFFKQIKNVDDLKTFIELLMKLKKEEYEVGEVFKKALSKINDMFKEGKISLSDYLEMIKMTIQAGKDSFLEFQSQMNYLINNKRELLRIMQILKRESANGNANAAKELANLQSYLNEKLEVSLQLLQEGKISLREFFQLWQNFGEYSREAVNKLKETASANQIIFEAMKQGFRDLRQDSQNQFEMMVEGFKNAFGIMQNYLSDTFLNLMQGKIKSLKDLFFGLFRDITIALQRTIAQMAAAKIMSAFTSGFSVLTTIGLAEGGVLPGQFIPFKKFASGGIATQPTLGLVAEGKYPEAVVPLPDGRSIPVKLMEDKTSKQQQTQQAINIVNVIDPKMVGEFLATSMGQNMILNVISNQANKIRKILVSA